MKFIFYCYLKMLIKAEHFYNEQVIVLSNKNPVHKTSRTKVAVTHENTSLLTYVICFLFFF